MPQRAGRIDLNDICGIPILASVVFFGLASALVTFAHAETTMTGRASVIDGDTIEIHGERIRFNGIDAPESSQTCLDVSTIEYRCGARSADALAEFLSLSVPTSCQFIERDRYGRFVGTCVRADGADVNEWMVRNGYALDWPRYSGDAYSNAQDAARAARRGMWEGSFDAPWDWRHGQRAATTPTLATSQSDRDCPIKGNINSKSDRIYHSPGQRDYGKTQIDESKGERWFCSDDEARAAGWRPAQR